MDDNPRWMFEYCRDRIQHLKAELELLRDMIRYLEHRKSQEVHYTPLAPTKQVPEEQPR